MPSSMRFSCSPLNDCFTSVINIRKMLSYLLIKHDQSLYTGGSGFLHHVLHAVRRLDGFIGQLGKQPVDT